MANPANQANGVQGVLDPGNRRGPGTAKDFIPLGICCSLVGLILLLVLLPLSFVTLEYYEYGLKRSRTRGVVDTAVIYGPGGRYFINPDTEFQVYQADAHVFDRDALSVVTKDKLEVKLDIDVLYFINRDQVSDIQKEYNLRYHSAVENNAISAIKNTAVNFTTADDFTQRAVVQTALHAALKGVAPPLFVTFPYFYTTGMQIAPTVAAKQLQTAIQNEINAKQLFENQAAEVRRVTDTLVNDLNNNATQIRQRAVAQASAAVREAEAEAQKIVDEARIAAAEKVFDALNLTTAQQRQQVDYMFGLIKRNDVKLRLGYQPQIVAVADAGSNNNN